MKLHALILVTTILGSSAASAASDPNDLDEGRAAPTEQYLHALDLLGDMRVEEGVSQLAAAARRHPEILRSREDQIVAYRRIGARLDDVISNLEAMVMVHPDDCNSWTALAHLRQVRLREEWSFPKLIKDRNDAAYQTGLRTVVEDHKRVVAICPSKESKRRLLEVFYSAKRYAEAAKTLEELVEENPEDTDLLRGLAHSHVSAGNLQEAAAAYERLLDLEPWQAGERLGYARVLDRLGLEEEAERHRQQVRMERQGESERYRQLHDEYKLGDLLEEAGRAQKSGQYGKAV